ncbi:hypothetical protein IT413_01130 [Candidatus Peregrinibacteria bacterium]|nr:hypothetical protein [Candidatus Peregrinibacteria bacterium]
MKKIFLMLLSLALFSFALTILFLSMRAIMAIGGSCAEGGPYVIANRCPGGTAWLTPLSIFMMIGGGVMYFVYSAAVENSPKWGYFFWSALFLSLGWNFLESSINPPGGGIEIGWLICGIMFFIMGGAPLFILKGDTQQIINEHGRKQEVSTLKRVVLGQNKQSNTAGNKFYETQTTLLIFHVIATLGGIYLGYLAFINT